jgi:hypothetical protein
MHKVYSEEIERKISIAKFFFQVEIQLNAHFPLGEFVRAKRKTNLGLGNVISQRKIRREKVGSVPTLLRSIQTGRDSATGREFSIFNDI